LTRRMLVRSALPASLLNFLAGIFAATGIGLLVTLETSGTTVQGDGTVPKSLIAIDAAAWIAASIFQAWAAHIAERVDQETSLVIDANIERPLRELVRTDLGEEWARRFWTLMLLTAVCVVAAITFILVPNL
jgi:hypothetical protein